MKKLLEARWKKNEDARAAWALFLKSPEFKAGYDVLAAQMVPQVSAAEDITHTALRQAYHAGFHACLTLLCELPDIQAEQQQQIMPEWGHIDPTNNS